MRNQVAVLALAVAGLVFVGGAKGEEEKGEAKVAFEQVPGVVRDALTK